MTPARRAELDRAYRRTRYVVELPGGELVLAIDHLDPDADRRLAAEAGCRKGWAILTACNPRSEPASAEDNARWTARLRDRIEAAGLRSLPSIARDPQGEWPDEQGFFVVDPELEWARAHGRACRQNAIVTGAPGEPVRLLWV